MLPRPPRSTPLYSSAASDVYKRQLPYVDARRIPGCAHTDCWFLLRWPQSRRFFGDSYGIDDGAGGLARDMERPSFFSFFPYMATGTLMALVQKNVKRMLAYSSIAHVGYLLAGLAAMGRAGDSEAGQSVLLYLAAYTFMNLGAFGILAYLKSCNAADFDYSLESMAGLGRRSAPAAILMTLFMFSLTGMPGTAGFIGKFYLFTAVVRADLTWLAVIAVLFSAVSAYYYLRIIVYMFFRETDRELSAEGTP